MKATAQIIKLSAGELVTKGIDLRRQIAKLRLEKFVGRNRNVRQVFMLRKQLAVTNTLLNMQKEPRS